MKDQWQAGNHDLGNQWTIKSLTEHSNFLTNISDIGKKVTAKERKGVKQVPLFRAIPVSRYITPILHITIGKGNNLLENILEEMQAAAERYSDRYYIKRRELYESQNKYGTSKANLISFNLYHHDYMKYLRHHLNRRMRILDDEKQNTSEVELEDLEQQLTALQTNMEDSGSTVTRLKKELEEEGKKPENSKAWGQPLRSKLDDILFEHGIDRSAAFGGALDGNDCRKLMGQASSILGEFREYILNSPIARRTEGVSDEKIIEIVDFHIKYLNALDGFLSNILVKRYEYNDAIGLKTRQYRDKCMQLERLLGFSITPKSHIIESHACEQQAELHGIGDLDESFGERNHQVESRGDVRYGFTRNFGMKERIKAKDHSQINCNEVQVKVEEIKKKGKAK